MTIEQRIQNELARLSKENTEIHSVAVKLNEKFNELIGKVKDHLGEISNEMREYDKHDASHSEAVLEIIEKLLQEKHIEELTLLEAMVLRFCCYFHDTGMILPAFCMTLLEQVEADPKAEPKEGLRAWLKGEGNDFNSRKELFLLPDRRDKYHDFLIRELMAYRDFRLGLEAKPEDIPRDEYVRMTRHYYLRRNHGERSRTYAANLGRFFADVIHGSEAELADIIGDICAAHGWEIEEVRKLSARKELFLNCTELSCNVRYLAMLLRLGDLLHFGPERASRTLYLERKTMNRESDLHWLAKQGTRGYVISPKADGGVDIAYHGSFDKPNEYYFVQEHMNWVNEELICYEAFRRQMEKASGDLRYDLGLPEKVNGDHMAARGFTPNRDFKFKLEHRNIIELLMGARLYRDEFMCLRELYQNALDACRCMRAERPGQETEIEFGLGTDDDGQYLYCRDQGTGMTMDIIKNYLLRIGNSYYKSDEFRRKNAHWGDAVAPVSEFGIGLLSCYMIADRIDVITRHYTAVAGEKPIWISMTDNDDFGYQRETNWFQENELGDHGTIVKLYLKEKFLPMATGYIPEEPRDVAFLMAHFKDRDWRGKTQYENSLFHRVQQFVHIPEGGIPVYICGTEKREQLFDANEWYDVFRRLSKLEEYGLPKDLLENIVCSRWEIFDLHWWEADYEDRRRKMVEWDNSFVTYCCRVEDRVQKASASVVLRLPTMIANEELMTVENFIAWRVCGDNATVHIDGIPIQSNDWSGCIRYNFRGEVRPRLTVDRGGIKEIPKSVEQLEFALEEKLIEDLMDRIRTHVRQYPHLQIPTFWDYVIHWLEKYLARDTAEAVLRGLSGDVMRNHTVCGAALYEWFHEETLTLDGNVIVMCPESFKAVLWKKLIFAASIRIELGMICIGSAIDKEPSETELEMLGGQGLDFGIEDDVVKADVWPEEYADYDAVNIFPYIVPPHAWRKLDRYDKIGNRLSDFIGPWSEQQSSSELEYPDRRDVLQFLQENQKHRGIYECFNQGWFREEGNRRYVAYVFIAPDQLTEDEVYLERQYWDVSEYIRGVREGWSILYYNYKDGYVIAPGIQKREDMLKLLPKEALEHHDGLEYYFTDDTFAF